MDFYNENLTDQNILDEENILDDTTTDEEDLVDGLLDDIDSEEVMELDFDPYNEYDE